MGTILEFLGYGYRACDALFAAAEAAVAQKDWNRARSQFGRFQAAMARHLAREENVLFPAFESATGNSMGPTQIMRMEHQQIRDLIQSMARAVADSNHGSSLSLSETLCILMRQHNLKEETMLYPMSDQVLDSERDAVIRAMEAVAL